MVLRSLQISFKCSLCFVFVRSLVSWWSPLLIIADWWKEKESKQIALTAQIIGGVARFRAEPRHQENHPQEYWEID